MRIVTDTGADFSEEQRERIKKSGVDLHIVPLRITLDGQVYDDLPPGKLYDMLAETESMPSTSQPAPGELADIYTELSKSGDEILSLHISSALSGTYNSAQIASKMVQGAKVTVVDSLSISAIQGWMVEVAVQCAASGLTIEQTVPILKRIGETSDLIFTLPDLKYLIHGGRIGHLQGLFANVLNIKPVISVSHDDGSFQQRGRIRTFKKAMSRISEIVEEKYQPGTPLRVQLVHSNNDEAVANLKQLIDSKYPCDWLPTCSLAAVLGAHTGLGLIGIAVTSVDQFPTIP
ncbi:DegV family protein [Anaerolineales bacterium]